VQFGHTLASHVEGDDGGIAQLHVTLGAAAVGVAEVEGAASGGAYLQDKAAGVGVCNELPLLAGRADGLGYKGMS
jgi:heme oxygenase